MKKLITVTPSLLIFIITLSILITGCQKEEENAEVDLDRSSEYEKAPTSDNVSAKALLGFKSSLHLVPFKSYNLLRSRIDSPQPTVIQKGWTNHDQVYFWTPGGPDPYIRIPLVPEKTSDDSSITAYNYIHIDYKELYPHNPSKLFLEMVLESEKIDKKFLVTGGYKGLHDLETDESQDVSSATLERKGLFYLAKRTLGLPFNRDWVYSQSGKNAVFQRRFNKSIKFLESMDLFFSPSVDISKVKLTFRMGWGGLIKNEDIVYWEDIPVKEILNVNGRRFLRIGLGTLFRERYKKKKNVTVKEMAVFIPGNSGQLAAIRPLENLIVLKEQNLKNRVDWQLPSATHSLPQDRKRLELNLWGMVNKTGHNPKIKSMTLLISPKNRRDFSGIDLQSLKVHQLVHIKRPDFLLKGEKLSQRWGGPFLTSVSDRNKVEWVKVNSYAPFQNIDGPGPYKSNPETNNEVLIHGNQGAYYRFVQSPALFASDLLFYSEKASFTIHMPYFKQFKKDRELIINWDVKGPLKVELLRRFLHPIKGNTMRVRLRKGEMPVLKVSLAKDASFFPTGRVQGKIVIKNVQVRDFTEEESKQNLAEKRLLHQGLTEEKLKKEDAKGIYIINMAPSGQILNTSNKNSHLEKSEVILHAEKPIEQWRSSQKGLVLRGQGEWLEIDWPVSASLKKDTRFYLGVSQGQEFITSTEITPISKGKTLTPILAVPNNSVPLNTPSTKIEHLKVNIKLRGGPYQLTVEEMALFEPAILSQNEAFEFPTLAWGKTPLVPENLQTELNNNATLEPGNLNAVFLTKKNKSSSISWTTKINRKKNWIRGLNLKYQLPQMIPLDNPCWLQLTMIGETNQVDQKLCSKHTTGQIFLPSDFLFQNSQFQPHETVNSVIWKIVVNNKKAGMNIPISINLDMALDGVNNLAVRNIIQNNPLFEWNGKNIFPILPDNISFNHIINNEGWINFKILNFLGNPGKIFPLLNKQHPDLQTQTLIFNQDKSFLSEETATKNKETFDSDTAQESGWVPLILAFATLVILIFLLWKKSKFQIKSLANLFNKENLIPVVLINRLVGIAAIGPGFWAIGRFADQDIQHILIFSLIVLLAGVIFHALRWTLLSSTSVTSQNYALTLFSRKDRKLPLSLISITAAVLGWAAWKLGQLDYGPHPAMLLIPFGSLIYFYLPWLLPFLFNKCNLQLSFDKSSLGPLISFDKSSLGPLMVVVTFGLFITGIIWSEFVLNLGEICLVYLWGQSMQRNRNKMEVRWPAFAKQIYKRKENIYFAGFLITMGAGVILLLFSMEDFAKHAVNISFFMFVAGFFQIGWQLYQERKSDLSKMKANPSA